MKLPDLRIKYRPFWLCPICNSRWASVAQMLECQRLPRDALLLAAGERYVRSDGLHTGVLEIVRPVYRLGGRAGGARHAACYEVIENGYRRIRTQRHLMLNYVLEQ